MPSQLTVTAKTGPAQQNTALVLADVTSINFDLVGRTARVYLSGAGGVKEYDLVGVTTVTFTISGANYTMVMS
jgi:hypothetical protein